MTSPDADKPHDIADTQMFRRFVAEAQDQQAPAGPDSAGCGSGRAC